MQVSELWTPEYYVYVKKRDAYRGHKFNAKKRGIQFLFTFRTWCQWWEEQLGSNWLEKRGSSKGQFVMGRKKDKGPYHPRNVKCITNSANTREAYILAYEKRTGKRYRTLLRVRLHQG